METYLHKYFVNKELTSFLIRLIDDIFSQCTSERFKNIADTISLDKEKAYRKNIFLIQMMMKVVLQFLLKMQ